MVVLLGAIAGSFFNMLIYRLPREKPWWGLKSRSHCDACKHILSWRDLLPIVSYVLLRGKCRYCKKSYGISNLLVEIATIVLFTTAYVRVGAVSGELFFTLILLSIFLLIFCIDRETMLIPDSLVVVGAIAGIGLWLSRGPITLHEGGVIALSSFLSGLFFFSIYFFSKGRAMGFGDVKYALALGLIFGAQAYYVITGAFMLGGLWGGALLILHKKKMTDKIPFGPFLSLSAGLFLLL